MAKTSSANTAKSKDVPARLTKGVKQRVLDPMARDINDLFTARTDVAFAKRWGIEIKTSYSFLGGGHVSNRVDGEDMTPEQMAWLNGWSDGYCDPMRQVRAAAGGGVVPEVSIYSPQENAQRMIEEMDRPLAEVLGSIAIPFEGWQEAEIAARAAGDGSEY